MSPTILITRPAHAARALADALRDLMGDGVPVVQAPLMRIVPGDDLPDVDGVCWLIFTSRHAVAAFARLSSRRDIPCYAVGGATAEAARNEGFKVREGGGDAPSLIARIVTDGVTGPCLYLRGTHAAADVAGVLASQGVACAQAVIYRQEALPLSDAARALLDGAAPVVVPLLSPRSARLLAHEGPFRAPICVAALSENVARALGPDVARLVQVAERPDLSALLRLVPGLCDAAKQLEGTPPPK